MGGLAWFLMPTWMAYTLMAIIVLSGISGLILTFFNSCWWEWTKKFFGGKQ